MSDPWKLIVIGYYNVVIKAMLGKTTPLDSKLAVIIAWAKKEVSIHLKISFYHVTHVLNSEANQWAKKAALLGLGELEKNGRIALCHIPQSLLRNGKDTSNMY